MPTTELMIAAFEEMRANPVVAAQEKFWHFVERFRADLVNQAFAILGTDSDAEDVAQESLCEAFRDLDRLSDPQQLGRWLRAVNRRNALDALRRRKRLKSNAETLKKDSQRMQPVRESAGTVLAKAEVVARAVDALPTAVREVVVLRYWEQLKCEEIAERLAIPVGTVKWRLSRAEEILEARLTQFFEPQG